MANELSRTYEVDGQEIKLSPASVMRYLLSGQQNVSEPEMAKVIMTCAARKLNPFAGDVHVLPHYDRASGTTKLSVQPSIDFFMRRAMANPRFRGIEDGIVVMANGVLLKKRGCGLYPELGEKLIGGWAAVYVEGYEKPVFCEVSLAEYSTGKSLWWSKPATMINKVAKSQGVRKAFPDDFQGLYSPEEMGDDEPAAAGAIDATALIVDSSLDDGFEYDQDTAGAECTVFAGAMEMEAF
ncbi:phage recombination protein Bet [Eggerthellaceae bacterium 24-137]